MDGVEKKQDFNLSPAFGRKGISFPFIFTGEGLMLHFPGGARLQETF